MSDSSGQQGPGPLQLAIRAAFVPDGQDPPAEFLTHFDQLRMRATYDPVTGQITCVNAGTNFHGDLRAEWHPDEDLNPEEGQDAAGQNGKARQA